MGNFTNYLVSAGIAGAVLGLIVLYFTKSNFFAGFVGIVVWLIIMFDGWSNKCDSCGNLGALKVTNSKLIGEDEKENHYYKRENVGTSVHRDSYGYESQTDNYQDVSYVDVTTHQTYRDTLVCENCGKPYNSERTESSTKTYRT